MVALTAGAGRSYGNAHCEEVVVGKANPAEGAQLSVSLLIQTVLFSVFVIAAVQHWGSEDSEERVISIPLRVTAVLPAAVSRCPAKRKIPFLAYKTRAVAFLGSGQRPGGCTQRLRGQLIPKPVVY